MGSFPSLSSRGVSRGHSGVSRSVTRISSATCIIVAVTDGIKRELASTSQPITVDSLERVG